MRHDSPTEVLARLREGDPRAADELHRRFVRRLVALASRRLAATPLRAVEAEDAVQSAFKSFFARQARGELTLGEWEQLWGLLALITVRKCARRLGRAASLRRGGGREVFASDLPGGADLGPEGLDRQPTPLEAAILAETVERLLAGLDPADRGIAERLLQGDTAPEAAAHEGCSERTVRRARHRLKRKLEALMAEEGGRA